MSEYDVLRFIHDTYGAMIEVSAKAYAHRSEVIAGIMMRESAGGKTLIPPGPTGKGDGGHGHGLMQIDDRSFPAFCASDDWQDPEKNIAFGSMILQRKRIYLNMRCNLLGNEMEESDLECWTIAAYNCGEGRAFRAIREKKHFDFFTAHHDYVAAVLGYADLYKSLTPRVNENIQEGLCLL
jgi:hypothetical protein